MTAYSDATLLGWLATKPEKLEKHLDKHPEDIDRLERLTALSDQQVAAMEQTVTAPDDIAERVISRMKLDPQLKEAGSVFADIMTIGFRTLRVVFGGTDDADGATTHQPGHQPTHQPGHQSAGGATDQTSNDTANDADGTPPNGSTGGPDR